MRPELRGAKAPVRHLKVVNGNKLKTALRYIMSMAVSDYSGQAWLQGFNDVGELIFGMPANDLLTIKAKGETEYSTVVQKACGQSYNFSCRAKQDTWKVFLIFSDSDSNFDFCG